MKPELGTLYKVQINYMHTCWDTSSGKQNKSDYNSVLYNACVRSSDHKKLNVQGLHCTCIHMHACTHSHMLACTHSHKHAHMWTPTHAGMHTLAQACTHVDTHTCWHAHTRTSMHTCGHPHMLACTHTCSNTMHLWHSRLPLQEILNDYVTPWL